MSHLSEADLVRLRQKLVREREALLAQQRTRQDALRGRADREIENGDDAENRIEQERARDLSETEAPVIADIERALEKLDDGTYGHSELSGEPIPLERLDAVPWARLRADEAKAR
jgi:DnaK suppressor protein